MRRLLIALVAVQIAVVGGVAWWWLRGPEPPPEPDNPVADVLRVAARAGPQRGLDRLGEIVVRAGVTACHRDVCIVQRFEGDKQRWATASAAGGFDPCGAAYVEACDRERTREALQVVLRAATARTCKAGPRRKQGRRHVVGVDCGKTTDDVEVALGGDDRWIIVGAPDFPGFLPNLFVSAAGE